jgi:hypothetical protein
VAWAETLINWRLRASRCLARMPRPRSSTGYRLGWSVTSIDHVTGGEDDWLHVLARKALPVT